MDTLTLAAFEFLERCDQHLDIPSLAKDFSATIDKFGFSHFIMSRIPARAQNLAPYVIAHNWPAFWFDRYVAENYADFDSVTARAVTQMRPFTWLEARADPNRTKRDLAIAAEFAEIGQRDGFAVSMRDPTSAHSGVSLGSEEPVALSPLHRKMLHMICLNAKIRAVELREPQQRKAGRLSDRESEILGWIADGKNTSEVSDILGISHRTVRQHTENARHKMDATSITAAVVRAIRDKLIVI